MDLTMRLAKVTMVPVR